MNASGADGIERLEAHLHGQAFALHRHDTYAIGLTFSGVQTFHFRGEQWHCLPGQCHILHPDEPHDGGTEAQGGFRYRIVYVDPSLVRAAHGETALPFVARPVVDGARIPWERAFDIWNFDETLDEIRQTELVLAAVSLLRAASANVAPRPPKLDLGRLSRVRELLSASSAEEHSMDELERIADLDRWTLARQFRAAFGTSPSRFRIMRRLDQARRSIRSGSSLAEAAIESGFADQSHMSRQFKRAYGLTPAKWAAMLV
ncbi:AraC family transcriptional regulator [Bradyrhizobium sp. ARR65]|uniref:AraC family transcriptional regulator n=1 Tax=Bradyrhizobium sp. ARR65 TaxID=1040989 RepID=UPI0006863D1B|nr:AraC family transcriptional regulator [Bradyrhizobium sp. ARR65]